ncbi:uncharacterized protein Dwil_GK19051 [Drosophila willistoni]|uniref:TGF-beta family profile domain-containing protein n=1 Tax=Drosophila willistoni TaxID=7260 RepID=B4MWA2_DROWI|nr:protein screw [Drosophila willistoni]EDW75972.1 uncharacterized protein Dwil_GK19051 [Drosophila willistoni]
MFHFILPILLATFVSGTTYITTNPHMNTQVFEERALSQQLEMIDLLDLSDRPRRQAVPNIYNSASKFLLEVYNEINEDQEPQEVLHQRHKRSLDDDILISEEDRQEIASCNSILTFSSRQKQDLSNDLDLHVTFNTNDVPMELSLMHAILRIYKEPSSEEQSNNLTVSIYRRLYRSQDAPYRILHSVNTTAQFKGWLEFNFTQTLRAWLLNKSIQQRHELRISIGDSQLSALGAGLVPPQGSRSNLEPFIVGYFSGPELLVKIQKLRFKRELQKRKVGAPMRLPPPPAFKPPHSCERLNFTVDFKQLHLHNDVIAPNKFEAYFCGGGCNFPLGNKMNATNHAIVQTLMHLKQPHLPKPCCVPTVLGSITILRHINEDIFDLTKYQKAVAKECGCH